MQVHSEHIQASVTQSLKLSLVPSRHTWKALALSTYPIARSCVFDHNRPCVLLQDMAHAMTYTTMLYRSETWCHTTTYPCVQLCVCACGDVYVCVCVCVYAVWIDNTRKHANSSMLLHHQWHGDSNHLASSLCKCMSPVDRQSRKRND